MKSHRYINIAITLIALILLLHTQPLALEASSLYETPTDAQTECIIADACIDEYMTPGIIFDKTSVEVQEIVPFDTNDPLPDHLTRSSGVFYGPSGKETYYNLPMGNCVNIMRELGYSVEQYPFWVREDGCKMLGYYVMIAANTNIYPKGTILQTSMGKGIVVDHCVAAERSNVIDITVTW